MNKKFSTFLVSALLLGGSLWGNLDAQTLVEGNTLAKVPEAGWCVIKLNATTTVSTPTVYANMYSLKADKDGVTAETDPNVVSDYNLWKFTEVKTNGSVKGYKLVNKAGFSLAIKKNDDNTYSFDKDGELNVFNYPSAGNYQLQAENVFLYWDNNTLKLGGSSEASNKNLAVGIYTPAPEIIPADELNAFLGKTEGFKLSIGKNDDMKAYENLQGNPFTGVLYAQNQALSYKDQDGTTQTYTKSSDDTYMLRQGGKDGKIIVLLTDNYNKQNSEVIKGVNGFKFAAYKEADLKVQLAKDALQTDEAKKVIKDIYFTISSDVNSKNLEVAIANTELIVSIFNGQTVLTTAASADADNAEGTENEGAGKANYANTTNNTYVRLGGGNLVDMTKFATGVNYYTFTDKDGKVAGANCSENETEIIGYLQDARRTQINMPEGQWVLDYSDGEIKFVNRESKQSFVIDANTFYTTDKPDVYEIAGARYTIKTVAAKDADNGYADFGKTSQKSYTIGLYSPIWGGVANLIENHSSEKHQIGMDVEHATDWKLIPMAEETEYNAISGVVENYTDSVYVEHRLSYYGKDKDGNKTWLHLDDTLKIVSYTIKNAGNGEFMGYNTDGNYYGCKETAVRFAFKKVGDSYNMIEVDAPVARVIAKDATETADAVEAADATKAALNGWKVYGGDSADKGLFDKVDCIYDRTENDLFKVEPADAAQYRRLENALETISIFRDENDSELLFEHAGFLGMANIAQITDMAPAMLADTAFVEDTDRPQYMLVVGNPVVTKGTNEPCPVCGEMDCEHSTSTYDTVEGRYLVNLKDSAVAFDAAHVHDVNPYINTEKYYRLGFVPAKRVNHTLTIASSEEELNVATPAYNVAKFAFRIVDKETQSFKIETANYNKLGTTGAGKLNTTNPEGWVKWMNGVVVVVDDIDYADVFNMNEDEDRKPTANEGVEAAGVQVIAANGAVIVKGAEGKKVVISNVLGQTIANTVIASSEATIAAPAGVVVVAVEGEAAVKAIVK